MSFAEEIARQEREAVRPAHAPELLLHPVAANGGAAPVAPDPSWYDNHAAKPRFYVGGVEWFLDLTGLGADGLSGWKRETQSEAKSANWSHIPNTPESAVRKQYGNWETIARQQYFSAFLKRAVTFPKAALVILSCELALQYYIDKQQQGINAMPSGTRLPADITSGAVVYRHMAIIPACWNVNEFHPNYIGRQHGEFLAGMQEETGQRGTEVFEELAGGHTVTYALAQAVKDYCERHGIGVPVREVRCWEGKGKKLGIKAAAPSEFIDL